MRAKPSVSHDDEGGLSFLCFIMEDRLPTLNREGDEIGGLAAARPRLLRYGTQIRLAVD